MEFGEQLLVLWQGEWEGRPFVLLPWQRKIVRDVFGWKRPDGRRRYRTVYVEVGKGNGKSPLAALMALLLLFADGEPAAEIYSLAGDRQQAAICHTDGKNMLCEDLAEQCEIYKHSIVVPATRSSWQVLTSKAATKHGPRPSGIIFDEFHVQIDRELYDTLRLGTLKRRQPLTVIITTAGVYDPESLAYSEHLYAQAVIDGEIEDPSYYGAIFALGKDDDWLDRSTWSKANPSLGVTIREDDLAELVRKAQNNPAEQSRVKQLHFNIWAEPVIEHGLSMEAWASCGQLEQMVCRGDRCFIGIDLSSKADLTAVVALFPHGDGSYSLIPHFWIPDQGLEERKRREVFDYPRHVKQGKITATPGTWIDQGSVREYLLRLRETYEIAEVAYDPHNASDLAVWMVDEGFDVVEVQQGFRTLSEPSKLLLALVEGGKLRHGNDPVLDWNASNTAFKRNEYDELRPMKHKLSRRRIDGVVAAIMALRQATFVEPDEGDASIEVWGGAA